MRRYQVLAVVAALVATLAISTGAAAASTGPVIATSGLDNGGRPCATAADPAVTLGFLSNQLEAYGTDATATQTTLTSYTFQIWPVIDPVAVTTLTDSTIQGAVGRAYVPAGVESDGATYGWRAQMVDDNGTSPWSTTCLFTVDHTAPPQATVTSANFPTWDQGWGPAGQLAQFTFSGGGSSDVVAFLYGWGDELPVLGCSASGPQGQLVCPPLLSQPGVVAADRPGGTASVNLPPPGSGPQTMTVAALDAAGNEAMAPAAHYRIDVPFTPPSVTQTSPSPTCGSTVTVTFAPNPAVSGVTSYAYGLNGDTSHTVTAAADGTGRVTIAVTANDYWLSVRSISANGFVSDDAQQSLDVDPQVGISAGVYLNNGQPAGGIGVPDTFAFTPTFDGAYPAAYGYEFRGGPAGTVPADPNSQSGTLTFTPNHPGPWSLTVTQANADGTSSCPITYNFRVATPRH